MIIQILLITVLLLIIISFTRSRKTSRTKAYKKILLVVFVITAIFFVLMPGLTTDFARLLGIGRGADLLLYGLTVAVIFIILNNYVKDREEEKRLVLLSRKVAIIEAMASTSKKNS